MKNYYYTNYNSFFFYLLLTFIICVIILILCYIISGTNSYYEKSSGYECGFDPFSDAREPFHVRFYLISILFILFDAEILFFFPWVLSINNIGLIGMQVMYIFIIIILLGFVYEWKKNSLDWD